MLSLSDLLKANDLYHAYLIHKQNVLATAIGRYLIRQNDPWPKDYEDYAKENPKNRLHRGRSSIHGGDVKKHWLKAFSWIYY